MNASSNPRNASSQAIQRQKLALLTRIRRNFLLKAISVAVSILLYFYVQAERNPTITRSFAVTLDRPIVPPDVELVIDEQQLEATVTGPRSVVDQLKDGDVHAGMKFARPVTSEKARTERPHLTFTVPRLSPENMRVLAIDSPIQFIHIHIFPQNTRILAVTALFRDDPPAGFRYDQPDIRPTKVKVVGRSDYVARVAKLLVNAAPGEPKTSIEGDFPVAARDSDNLPVEGVTLVPETIHVAVPLVEELPTKIVFVSPTIADLPVPPYKVRAVSVSPSMVSITGKLDRVNVISFISTENIPVHDLTGNLDMDVGLVTPPRVIIRDLSGHRIQHVRVQISIEQPIVAVPTPLKQPGP